MKCEHCGYRKAMRESIFCRVCWLIIMEDSE